MTLRIGLVGAGSIGRIHARNIAGHPAASLAVVCDRNPEAAGILAAEYGQLAATSVREALDRELDGAIIASSTASHGDIATECVAARLPFLCEKPLAQDLATAQDIVAATRAADIFGAIAFNRRFDAGYAGIKAAVSAGEIGRVESILITSRTAAPPSVEFTRTSGGLFGEKGAHFYDLACWIAGEFPVELFAMGSALVNPAFADIGEADTAMITMRMPSGALCQFDFSWRAAYGQDERLEVNGALGMLQTFQKPVGGFFRSRAEGQSSDGLMLTWYERFAPTYAEGLDRFLAAIRSGDASALPSLKDGLAAQQIADAARESAKIGKPIHLR